MLAATVLKALGSEFSDFIQNRLPNDLQNDYQKCVAEAYFNNPWFVESFVLSAMETWANALESDKVETWLENYQTTQNPKNVAVIGAGNLPLVALHDILCVLASGHNLWLKCASDDAILTPFVVKRLIALEPKLQAKITIKDAYLTHAQALIATGSNNSSRYFEYYFREIPKIIRKNRTSVAILDAEASTEDLKALASDIFMYFGRGCRSVTKLYVPVDFNIQRIFENSTHFAHLKDHNKYANNFDYHRAIYLMNKDVFLENDFFVVKQSEALHAPVSVLFYEHYHDKDVLLDKLKAMEEDIQVIGGVDCMYGQHQSPSLSDYADKLDSMAFLQNL